MAQPVLHRAHAARPSLGAGGYVRRRPEETALYRCVERHGPAFRKRAEEQGGLPKFVVREVEEYLSCGRLAHGCLRLSCCRCGFERLVAFSCKRRGFCPSCLGRRMTDTALHLVERILYKYHYTNKYTHYHNNYIICAAVIMNCAPTSSAALLLRCWARCAAGSSASAG